MSAFKAKELSDHEVTQSLEDSESLREFPPKSLQTYEEKCKMSLKKSLQKEQNTLPQSTKKRQVK